MQPEDQSHVKLLFQLTTVEVVCDDHPCEMTKLEVERCVITGLNVLESPKKVAMCLAQFGDRYP